MEEVYITSTVRIYQPDELDADDKRLVELAKEATLRSYSRYSGFAVGAAVMLEGGETVIGCNQENAAFSVTVCAERTALFAAGAQFSDRKVAAIAIAARTDGDFTPEPVTPCGTCRQALVETELRSGREIRIIMYGRNRIFTVDGIKSLLPLSFNDSSM